MPGVKNYIFKDGAATEGKGEKLVDVNFSNWYAGNADPEDLRRHRELNDRMNFRGPFWEGKRPTFAWEEPPIYPYVAPEEPPDEEFLKKKEAEGFVQVKR
jgi:hypothetical protein